MAVINTDEGTEGVYETEQLLEERAHDGGEKVPVPLVFQVIVPVGEAAATVAVHVDAVVTVTGEGVQLTEVVATLGAKLTASSAQPPSLVRHPR